MHGCCYFTFVKCNQQRIFFRIISDSWKTANCIAHDSAFDVFGKTTSSKSHSTKRVNKNNEWFDENCQKAKRDFKNARNNFNRMKTDETRSLSFTRARTRYNRTKQKAKKKFKIKEGNRINN